MRLVGAKRTRESGPGKSTKDPARAEKRTSGIRRLFTWKKLLGGFLLVCLLGVGAFVALYLLVPVPDANADAKRQSNVYRYSDGTELARTGKINREVVPLSKVPEPVRHAFVAAENKTFYKDSGVDLKGTARGLINTVTGKGKQGGSTITQQYVKNYFLGQEQTVTRKAKEVIIALKVDREMSKDEILAGYLNTSYFGRNAYGIQAAARAYYGVDVDKLTVEQGAYLASLLQAPSQYDWTTASETSRTLVLRRWNYVLDNMVEMRWLDGGTRGAMSFPTPGPRKPPPGPQGQAGYLVEAAKEELLAAGVKEDELAAGGWTITLGVDREKQRALEKAVDRKLMSDLDPKSRPADAHVQVGAASVDPRTGRIVAMYGGQDYLKHYTNNATRRDYQPASTFKPLILAAALEHGARTQDGVRITPNTIYDGTHKRPVRGSGEATPYAPENEDHVSYGPITVQKAMNASVNSVFAQMAVDVGLEKAKKTAVELGMDGKANFPAVPSMSLGAMGASPRDMAGVYATLANHGKKVTPHLVKSAERGEQKANLPSGVGKQVISRSAADTLTSVLTGVVDDGTGAVARSGDYEVAGKTGTSDDNKSAWFTGYTPSLATAVGLFGEDSANSGKQVTLKGAGGGGRVNGSGYPARIWNAYTQAAMSGVDDSEDTTFDLEAERGPVQGGPPAADRSPSGTATPGRPASPRAPSPGASSPSGPPRPSGPPSPPVSPPPAPPSPPVSPSRPQTPPDPTASQPGGPDNGDRPPMQPVP
ncbi:transglycosylase domain-containing protein [Streptomyces sp. URMC 123]|uniref:transglycosylase domain-containing protein n=1 Tax=Streptomyces sp. URMC 123 TaxID=3423403 RepID=UPI003F1D6FB3